MSHRTLVRLSLATLTAIGACAPSVPDATSGDGVDEPALALGEAGRDARAGGDDAPPTEAGGRGPASDGATSDGRDASSVVADAGMDVASPDATVPVTASAGCGKSPYVAAGARVRKTVVAAGKTRELWVSVPAGYDPNKPTPLVFAYHSCGGSGEAPAHAKVRAFASAMILVTPQGLPMSRDCGGPGWSDPSDLPFFDEMVKQLSSGLCIDTKRIVSLGHSYGGEMTNLLACQRGDKLLATASFSGGAGARTFQNGKPAVTDPRFQEGCVGAPATFFAHAEGDTSPAPFEVSETLVPKRLRDRQCQGPTAYTVTNQLCRNYNGCRTPVSYCRLSPYSGGNPHGVTFDGNEPWLARGLDFLSERLR